MGQGCPRGGTAGCSRLSKPALRRAAGLGYARQTAWERSVAILRMTQVHDPVAESWTGIGVVLGFWGVVLLLQGPHVKHVDSRWRITLIHILPFVMATCKTRNQ